MRPDVRAVDGGGGGVVQLMFVAQGTVMCARCSTGGVVWYCCVRRLSRGDDGIVYDCCSLATGNVDVVARVLMWRDSALCASRCDALMMAVTAVEVWDGDGAVVAGDDVRRMVVTNPTTTTTMR